MMSSDDLRKVIEDKLISKGMDEDLALQIADEIIDQLEVEEDEPRFSDLDD